MPIPDALSYPFIWNRMLEDHTSIAQSFCSIVRSLQPACTFRLSEVQLAKQLYKTRYEFTAWYTSEALTVDANKLSRHCLAPNKAFISAHETLG